MIEILATLARWSQLVANLVLFGSCVFLAIAGRHRVLFENPWVARLERAFPWLAGIILIGLVGILATTTGEATGDDANTWRPSAWLEIIQHTNMGHMWAIRAMFAVLLLAAVVSLQYIRQRVKWHYVICAGVAALPLIAGALVSHSAAEENFLTYVSIYSIHILLAGIWFGALPAFLLIVFDRSETDSEKKRLTLNIEGLKRFSSVALPVMLVIMITGLIITDRMIEDDYHALVASSYGWLLNTKLALLAVILFIAYKARAKWLPAFEQMAIHSDELSQPKADKQTTSFFAKWMPSLTVEQKVEQSNLLEPSAGVAKLRKWVRVEFVLALFLVLFATILSNTVPAKHEMVEHWPYSFRFSIAATWEDPEVQLYFWIGMTMLGAGIASIWWGSKHQWDAKKRILLPSALMATAIAVALPKFAVDAYPETYQNTPVPFDAISISNGARHFAENCTSCHGPQGAGNGILAKTFDPPPADLLTEPHTARHTAGDFFHWLSYGLKNTGMPGFAANLTEEDRWDTVNYMHAMSRGYQARLMSPSIVPGRPSMGPPIFQFTTYDGSTGILKDYRGRSNVLLVFFSWPDSQHRLAELSDMRGKLRDLETEILAVPMDEYSGEILSALASEHSYPLVTEGWHEIRNSYILFRRTLTHPDILGEGNIPDHMEYLIDRYGYLRARWIPAVDESGWDDTNQLTRQLSQLNQEGEILPPPDDHVH
ncbi:putative copper resistance protein D [Nitrosomonas halophila]|uniref:Putative copper resistance protein D n=1 Tax=Nitrosomonas halophila TaxID=44576 RepID=A0A1H3NSQ2_9PROT|nr:c-type cytochrome [Nitrosomonas halophila]SDY91956.1 putative copper resistance protein D [Nitrosomonas halophila]